MLRPGSWLLVDMRRRDLLYKTFGAWTLAVQWSDKKLLAGRTFQIARLMKKAERHLMGLGMEGWKAALTTTKAILYRKATCFGRWRLHYLTGGDMTGCEATDSTELAAR